MSPDVMPIRLHLRRMRVIAVLVDLVDRLVVEICDGRRVVRCPDCGFKTARVHDRRRLQVWDLPVQGRATELVWVRRRFSCANCSERHWETHPEIIVGRRTHVTRRLARQVVIDANVMSNAGSVSPLRAGMALHHETGHRLVASGGRASS